MEKRFAALVGFFVLFCFSIQANTAPSINLGANKYHLAGKQVSLDATVADQDGDNLSVVWKVLSAPSGSTKTLSNFSGVTTQLTLDRIGVYILEAIANDGQAKAKDYLTVYSVESVGETVFGPINYFAKPNCTKTTTDKTKCLKNTDLFDIIDTAADYSLLARNNGYISASLELNGQKLTSFYDFSGQAEILVKDIELIGQNTLISRVGGNTSADIEIEIKKDLIPVDNNSEPIASLPTLVYFGNDGADEAIIVTDPDINQGYSLTVLQQPINGTIAIVGDQIEFTPNLNAKTNSSFVLAVFDDGTPQKATTVVGTIVYSTGNRPPIVSGTMPASEGEPKVFSLKIEDNTGDEHIVTLKSPDLNGQVSIANNNRITYTPNPGFVGDVSFEVTVSDNQIPQASTDFTVTGRVNPNLPPVLAGRAFLQIEQGNIVSQNLFVNDPNLSQTLNIEVVQGPNFGTFSVDENGRYIYRAGEAFSGTEFVTVRASDNATLAGFVEFTIEFETLENNIPTAILSPRLTQANSGIAVREEVLFRDNNRSQQHEFSISRQPNSGTASLEGTTLTYTPNSSFQGQDQVVVSITDNGFPQKTGLAVFDFNVTNNTAPNPSIRWNLESNSISSNISKSFTVLANDPDRSQAFVYSIESQPQNGVIFQNPFRTNTFTYTPNPGFFGLDTFSIQVIDNGTPILMGSVTGQANVLENRPPNTDDINLLANEGLLTNLNFLINDPDIGQSHTYEILTAPTKGTFSIINNTCSYRPNNGEVGNDIVTVRITDNGSPQLSNTFNVNITIQGNSVPILSETNLLMHTTVANLGKTVFLQYTDPDEARGQQLQIEAVSGPSNGVFAPSRARNGSVRFTYQPNLNFTGQDSVTVRLSDNGTPSLESFQTFVFQVDPNSPPNPTATSITALQGYPTENAFVFSGDPDQGQIHTYDIFAQPIGGVATVFFGGRLQYRPFPGFFGVDQIGVIVTETNLGTGLSGTTVVSVNIEENLPPNPTIEPLETFQSTPVTGTIEINDPNTRVDNSRFRATYELEVQSFPKSGTVAFFNQSSFTYTPSPGFVGTDTFDILITETPNIDLPQDLSAIVTVTVNVTGNSNPSISYSPQTITSGELGLYGQINFTDVDSFQTLSIELVEDVQHGELTLNPNGSYSYNSTSFSGNDQFVVKVIDNAIPVGETTETIIINVVENTPPIITSSQITVFQGQTGSTQIEFTDTNPGQTHDYSIVTQPQNGTATLTASGLLSYEPIPGSTSSNDSIRVRVTDSSTPPLFGEIDIPVQITLNTIPVLSAAPPSLDTFQSTSTTVQVSFTDPDINQTHTYAVESQPLNGVVSLDNQTGQYTYTPSIGFSGNDNFTVSVSDNAIPSGKGTLTIQTTVQANSPPVLSANPSSLSTFQSTPITTSVSFVDSDTNQNHTYSIEVSPNKGTATIDQNGLLTYNPIDGLTGNDSVTVAVTDNATPPGKGTLSIPINIIANSLPTISGDFNFDTFQGDAITKVISVEDIDVGQIVNLTVDQFSQKGSVSVQRIASTNNFSVTYTPQLGESGQDTFTLNAFDNAIPNGQTQKVVTLTITPNTAPAVSSGSLSFEQSDTAKTFQVLFTDPDPSQTHTYSITQQGSLGIATVDQTTGLLTYTPYFNSTGTEDLTVRVRDNAVPRGEGFGTVTINIAPNKAPTLNGPIATTIQTSKSGILQFSATDDNTNQGLAYSIESFPNEVSAFIDQATGELTLSAGEFYTGTDTFEVRVRDNGSPILFDTLQVTVTVEQGNFRPAPLAQQLTIIEDSTGTIQLDPNDQDLNDQHTYLIINQPNSGSATIDPAGLLTYTPNSGFVGTDDVFIQVTDNGDPNLASNFFLSIEVEANSAPQPIDQTFDLLAGRTITSLVDPNDSDTLQSHRFSIPVQPSFGTAQIDSLGNLEYTTLASDSGLATFNIEVQDDAPTPKTGQALISVNVIANNAPSVISDNFGGFKNQPVKFEVEYNDTDQEIQTYQFSLESAPLNGQVSIDSVGGVNYQPNIDFVGNDQFSVRVTDDVGLSSIGTFDITILDGNTPPSIDTLSFQLREASGPFRARFRLRTSDIDGDVVRAEWDFGDGTPISILEKDIIGERAFGRVFHSYKNEGTYNVTLTIFDNLGLSTQVTNTYNVVTSKAPQINITANTIAGPSPLTVNLDASNSVDPDGTIDFIEWYVEQTDEVQTGLTANFNFQNTGIYNIEVFMLDNDRVVSTTDLVISVDLPQENQIPFTNISTTYALSQSFPYDVTVQAEGTIDFDGSIVNTRVYSGDNLSPDISFSNSSQFSYQRPDSYLAGVTAEDDSGANITKNKYIHIGPDLPPVAGVFPVQIGPREVRLETVLFGHYDSSSFIWDFGDGNFSNEKNPTHIYSASGSYDIKLYYFDVYGRLDESTTFLFVDNNINNPTIVAAIPEYQEISPGQSISFDLTSSSDPLGAPLDSALAWFADGTFDDDTLSTSHTFNTIGIFPVRYFVRSDRGTASLATYFVNVISGDGPQPVVSVDNPIGSAPHTFTLDASSSNHPSGTIVSGLWKSNDLTDSVGLPGATPNAIETITLEDPGIYYFEYWVKDSLGNTRVDGLEIEVNP